ncbi:MAG: GNAT family N-acetyltransferase [Leptospiraceae bacterium]|nr:GNAT family N-acetyltransferase [Leptospiraceae bacterium]MDW7975233.1 GNAT family N-acetyltransferase [Leptospiraceae bacterium]
MKKQIFKNAYVKSLVPFFYPESIAILYAKNEGVSKQVLLNLIQNPFGGVIYPINPDETNVLGIKTHASLDDVSEPIDLVIITEDYPYAFTCLQECLRNKHKIQAIMLISFGFRDDSLVYSKLKETFLETLRKENIRVLGPNSIGIISPYTNFNGSILSFEFNKGNIAFLTQSGSIGSSILDWSIQRKIGFSGFVSLGSSIDVDFGELIDYFGHDPHTKSMILYLETIKNPKNFLSAAREISLSKPIVVLRSGKFPQTQSLIRRRSGHPIDEEVLNAAFHRCGILRVETVEDLFFMAEVLSEQMIPTNHHLAIISNGSGLTFLAMDKYLEHYGSFVEFSKETKEQIKKRTSIKVIENPLMLPPNSLSKDFIEVIKILNEDPVVDGILLILAPSSILDFQDLIHQIITIKTTIKKPFLISLVGGIFIEDSLEKIRNANIPVFDFPDQAVKIFHYMYRYYVSIRALYETPEPLSKETYDYLTIFQIFHQVEEKSFNVPTEEITFSEEESMKVIQSLGIIEVLEKFSEYKELKVKVGSFVERIMGPIIYLQVDLDEKAKIPIKALGLPPLNTTLVKRMFETSTNFKYVKFHESNLEALQTILIIISNFVLEFPQVCEFEFTIDFSVDGFRVLSPILKIYHPNQFLKNYVLPVIRPYPKQYIEITTLKNGLSVLFRPILPEDEPLVIEFHQSLSERSVYHRYMQPLELKHRIKHERLVRICFLDFDREIAIIALDRENSKILGIGRLSHHPYRDESEFAILISDAYQGMGIGTKLLEKLLDIARKEKKKTVYGIILKENIPMIKVCEKLGFQIHSIDIDLVKAEISL